MVSGLITTSQREAAATAFRGLWRRSLCRVGDCWAWRLSRCPVAVLWLPCHPFGCSRGWVGHRVGWMLPGMDGGGGMVSGLITTSQREAAATAFRGLWRRFLCRVGDCWAWRLSRCPVAVLWLPCHPFGLSRGWVGHRVGGLSHQCFIRFLCCSINESVSFLHSRNSASR